MHQVQYCAASCLSWQSTHGRSSSRPPRPPGARRGGPARHSSRAWAPAGCLPAGAPRPSARPAWPAGSPRCQSTCDPARPPRAALLGTRITSCLTAQPLGPPVRLLRTPSRPTRPCLRSIIHRVCQRKDGPSQSGSSPEPSGQEYGSAVRWAACLWQQLLLGLQRAILGPQQRLLLLLHRPRGLLPRLRTQTVRLHALTQQSWSRTPAAPIRPRPGPARTAGGWPGPDAICGAA